MSEKGVESGSSTPSQDQVIDPYACIRVHTNTGQRAHVHTHTRTPSHGLNQLRGSASMINTQAVNLEKRNIYTHAHTHNITDIGRDLRACTEEL